MNTIVLLTVALSSHDADASASSQVTEEVMLYLISNTPCYYCVHLMNKMVP